MKPITWNPLWDLSFEENGVCHYPSGTTPHNPDQLRIVFRNCETTKATPALDKEISEAAERGSDALMAVIESKFRAVGRAQNAWWNVFDADNEEVSDEEYE